MCPIKEFEFDETERDTVPVFTLGARVLVAEDDPALRRLIVTTFANEGYEVDEAPNGAEALDAITAIEEGPWGPVDLLVLDLFMPRVTGLDILRRLRAAAKTTPAILVTAFPDAAVVAESSHLHAMVLAKPFSLDMLTGSAMELLVSHSHGGAW